MKPCLIPDCPKPAGVPGTARGWCSMHYHRWQKTGDPLTESRPVLERLLEKVVVQDDGCWHFTGSLTAGGYGQLWWNRQQCLAHRVSYALHKGPIPDGLELDHLCRFRSCVNPEHLEPVTARENQDRAGMPIAAFQIAKTTCPQGHAYDDLNTYVTSQGHRKCRECNLIRKRAQAAQKRAIA